jgi:hypothetical protein
VASGGGVVASGGPGLTGLAGRGAGGGGGALARGGGVEGRDGGGGAGVRSGVAGVWAWSTVPQFLQRMGWFIQSGGMRRTHLQPGHAACMTCAIAVDLRGGYCNVLPPRCAGQAARGVKAGWVRAVERLGRAP